MRGRQILHSIDPNCCLMKEDERKISNNATFLFDLNAQGPGFVKLSKMFCYVSEAEFIDKRSLNNTII